MPPADGPPKLLQSVTPEYPPRLKEQRITGWANLDLRIDEKGDVSEVTVNEATLSEFGQAAVNAVRQFKFQPAHKAGRPFALKVRLPVIFNLDDAALAEMESHRPQEVLPPGPPTLEISAVDEWPELKEEVRPKTPAVLKDKGWMGEATVGFVVDEKGIPRDVHLVETTEAECTARAVAAVRQWKFTPARKDRQAVRVALEVPVVFFPETTHHNGARMRPGVSNRMDRWKPGPDMGAGKMQPPRRIKTVEPGYPEEMRYRDLSGDVTLEVVVDARGLVTYVHAVDAENAFFSALAEHALSYWTYAPATRSGMPIPCRMLQPMGFRLYGR